MEKEIFYKLYYFEFVYNKKRKIFYFENKKSAEIARFDMYCRFDYERLTIRGFVPPVSIVKYTLIAEKDIDKISYCSSYEDYLQELERIFNNKNENSL